MKVAVLNRGRDAFPGGDIVHLFNLSDALARIGIHRTYMPDRWSPTDLRAYDLVHVHHTNFTWSRQNFDGAIASGVPFVCTTIYYPTDKLGLDFAEQGHYLNQAHALITYTDAEATEVVTSTSYQGQLVVIPPGVDVELFAAPLIPTRRVGVLTVAARAGDKNCDKVEAACARLGLPYKQAIGLTPEQLATEYRVARVFVNASGHESFGLTILEALASGCRVLVNERLWACEWFPGIAAADTANEKELDSALASAYNATEWDWRPNAQARTMTWDLEAERMKTLYEKVLQ